MLVVPLGFGTDVYKLFSVEARTESCGNPASVYLGLDIFPSTETLNFLWDRYELISFIKLTGSCNFNNLYNKPGCHVVLKAFSMSKNTASVGILLLKFRVARSVNLVHLSDVHCNVREGLRT